MERRPLVQRVAELALATAHPDALAAFFCAALDAHVIERRREDEAFARVLGLPEARVERTTLRIGAQHVALLTIDPPGRPYPLESTSTDLWFQHFAFIVSDMDEAYARLMRVGTFTPISQEGPQRLPPEAGSVVAFKFRDLEGHPLEFLAFPAGEGPEVWRGPRDRPLVLGIDHSAISVADAGKSIDFFERVLWLRLGPCSLNQGPAQAAMDDVPHARVSVSALLPHDAPPHVELLGYEVGTRRPLSPDTRSNDVAATFFVLETDDLTGIAEAAEAAGAQFVSPGIVALPGDVSAIMLLDPDGHRFLVRQPAR